MIVAVSLLYPIRSNAISRPLFLASSVTRFVYHATRAKSDSMYIAMYIVCLTFANHKTCYFQTRIVSRAIEDFIMKNNENSSLF